MAKITSFREEKSSLKQVGAPPIYTISRTPYAGNPDMSETCITPLPQDQRLAGESWQK